MGNRQPLRPVKRILIVDDDVSILGLLREILEPEGHEIYTAGNGAEALSMVLDTDFDLIITDYRMPQLSGKEFYERAVALKPGIKNRFVFNSGELDPAAKTEFIRQTGVRVIAKPFKADLVRLTVREALEAGG
jgi:CheY-like chemotaxis protein